jgi:exosortase
MTSAAAAPPSATAPLAQRVAWIVVAAGALAVMWGLVRYWLKDYDSADRGLIVAAAAWAAQRRWPTVTRRPGRIWPLVGLALLFPAAIAFLPPWFVYVQVGPRPILLWWEAAAVMATAAGLLLMSHGPAAVTALRFPMLFPFLALPLPGRVINPLQAVLQDWTTWLAAGGLSGLGITVHRDGFVLALPGGDLGVVEACSGIRSVTALVAIACFIAHVRGFGLTRGILTVVLAIPVIILVNAIRVIITGLLQEYVGRDVIEGWRHELLGFVMVLVGLALVVGITWLLTLHQSGQSGQNHQVDAVERPPASLPNCSGDVSSTSLMTSPTPFSSSLNGIAAVWLVAVAGAAGYLSTIPSLAHSTGGNPPLDQIPDRFGEWRAASRSEELEINDQSVARTLGTDTLLHRIYTRLGYEAHVWVMHWESANGVRDYHHPDVCWPNRGFVMQDRRIEPIVTPAGRHVPLTYREFSRGKDRQVVVYWTQEGRRIWTSADEQDAISPIFPLKWIAKRVASTDPTDTDDRLAVLVGMQIWEGATFGQNELFELTGKLADEVYRICPWADPGAASTR